MILSCMCLWLTPHKSLHNNREIVLCTFLHISASGLSTVAYFGWDTGGLKTDPVILLHTPCCNGSHASTWCPLCLHAVLFLQRFMLTLHVTQHRRLFKKGARAVQCESRYLMPARLRRRRGQVSKLCRGQLCCQANSLVCQQQSYICMAEVAG